jgi:hypothetical protein
MSYHAFNLTSTFNFAQIISLKSLYNWRGAIKKLQPRELISLSTKKKTATQQKSLRFSCCATQGDPFEALLQNLYKAVEGCLLVDIDSLQLNESAQILEIAV